MLLQSEHLRARDRPIQIGREQLSGLSALLYRGALHDVTSTLLSPPEPCEFFNRLSSASFSCSRGMFSPNSAPDSRTYPERRRFNAARPRVNLDFTVPSEISSTSAISSYDISSKSRKTRVVRYGSGTSRNSASTLCRTSQWTALSKGDSPRSTNAACTAHSPIASPSVSIGSIDVSRALCRNHQRLRFAASCNAMR